MARESTSGTAIPSDSPAAKARPHTIGLAAASVTAGFLSQDPAEAAHVQSRSRTEPMRLRLPTTSSVEVSIPRERSRLFQRHLSGIELAALLGLRVARRGFWDAASPNSLGRKEETTPSARGNASWPDPVELFGAVSVLPRMDAVA